jgi:hypothetical protein
MYGYEQGIRPATGDETEILNADDLYVSGKYKIRAQQNAELGSNVLTALGGAH